MTHNEFLEQKVHPWNAEGEIELPLVMTPDLLEAIVGSKELLKNQEGDYHCLPLSVKLSSVRSTFPIPVDISLRSEIPESSARSQLAAKIEQKRQRNGGSAEPSISLPTHTVWSNVSGASSTGKSSYYIVTPRQSKPRNPLGDFLYIAPEITLNHPDFSRFSVTDFHSLREELERSRVDAHTYRIEGEEPTKESFKSLLFWLLATNFPLITDLGIEIEDTLPKNRVYMTPLNLEGRRIFIDVPSAAMDEVIRRIEMAFDRDALFMNLRALSLVIKPTKGIQGWEEYKEIYKKRDKYAWTFGNSLEGVIAQFSAVLELAFEPYQVGKDTKLLALESSSYSGTSVGIQRFQPASSSSAAVAMPTPLASETADALAAAGLAGKPPVDWGARVDRQTALNYAKDRRF